MEALVGGGCKCRFEVGEQIVCRWTVIREKEYKYKDNITFPLPTLPSFVSSTTGEAETR